MEIAASLGIRPDDASRSRPGWMPREPASLKRRRPTSTTPRQLACTLLAAIVGENWAAFAQIGDGVIVFDGPAGLRARLLAGQRRVREHHPVPDRGRLPREPADRDRRSPGDRAGRPHRRPPDARPGFRPGEGPRPVLRATVPHAPKNGPDEETLRASLLEFMDSKRVNDRTDDDKTLLLATRSTTDVPPSLPDPTA